MTMLNVVADNMKNIQGIFQQVQALSVSNYTMAELMAVLDNFDVTYRSIAYESASMSFALLDLQAGTQLTNWNNLLRNAGNLHTTQIYVGLGWALAHKQLNPTLFLSNMAPYLRYRIFDGYGYYEGVFRKRKSIINQEQPNFDNPTALSAYHQGLGRSIWYINEGNIQSTTSMLDKLPKYAQADFWRGIGIATTYVGGCNQNRLIQIIAAAENYLPQLKAGAAMATSSRFKANYISADTDLTCAIWLNKTVAEIIALNESIQSKLDATSDTVYADWLLELERSL